MTYLRCIVLLLFCASIARAQHQNVTDSLRALLQSDLGDSVRLEVYRELLRNEPNEDSLMALSKRIINFCENKDCDHILGTVYIEMARTYQKEGFLSKSLELYYESLKYQRDDVDIAATYSNIGNVYQHNDDFPNAYKNYRKASEIFLSLKDSLRIGTTYISLGYAYYLQDRLDSAHHFLDIAVKIYDVLDVQYRDYYWSYAEGNLALVLLKMGQHEESEARLTKVFEILQKYGDTYAMSDYKIELAKNYLERGDVARAITIAHEGTQMAVDKGYKKFIREGSRILAQGYKKSGDFKQAYRYQSDFIAYNDSIANDELVRQLANQRTEFEVGQKQAEVDLLTQEKRNQQIILYATSGFAVLLFGLVGVVFMFYRSKSRTNRILAEQKLQLESLNQTKDKFFSIISHDLRGPVSSFHGVTRLMKTLVENGDKESLLMFAEEMDKSVTQLSALLDNLLTWAMQQQGNFSYNPQPLALKGLVEEMVGTLANMAKGKSIILHTDVPDDLKVWADRNTTVTILRNLANNALKFTPPGGRVSIIAKKENGQAEIRVMDTGVGMPQEKLDKLFVLADGKSTFGTQGEKGLGLGLQLVQEFMDMNDGTIRMESEEGKGTTFILTFPVSAQAVA